MNAGAAYNPLECEVPPYSCDGRMASLSTYRERIHDQFRWTNRALDNRCRPETRWDQFTKEPLRIVNAFWRPFHVFYAKARHHRAQARSSSCLKDKLLGWYYSSGAKCIHEHEGAWDDPGAPYWGGFQADLSFQTTYNPEAYRTWGTADRWPVIEQIEMAYNGWRARGWYPWPNTARACGLL